MNNFKYDLKAEQELGLYLDKYLYEKSTDFSWANRIKESEMEYQYSGIDVKALYHNTEILIDEKGFLSDTKVRGTFALEISYINPSGERVEGWLFDPQKETTHYLFCWNKRNDNIDRKNVTEKDFHYVIAMLVSREHLHDYLNQTYGITRLTANHKVNEIVTSNKGGSLDKLNNNTRSKYYYSVNLNEKPINIVMDKKELKEIAIFYKLVKRSELVDAK